MGQPTRDLAQFGQLIKELRKETQKEFSKHLGINHKVISEIETGKYEFLTYELVEYLLTSLKADGYHKNLLFLLAGFVPPEDVLSEEQELELIKEFYRSIREPTFIYDALYDVHSVNSYALAMFENIAGDFSRVVEEIGKFNILLYMFAPGIRKRRGWENWQRIVETNVYLFKLQSIYYQHTERYKAIIKQLESIPAYQEISYKVSHTHLAVPNRALSLIFTRMEKNSGEEKEFILANPTLAYKHYQIANDMKIIMYIPFNDKAREKISEIKTSTPYEAFVIRDGKLSSFYRENIIDKNK